MEHHAHLIRSVEPLTFTLVATADTQVQYYDAALVGVGEVKELVNLANRKPTVAATLTIIVRTNQITVEAQNALLKIIEEPPITTRFFIVVPVAIRILPTLLSRVTTERSAGVENETAWDVFRAASISDRLAQIDTWQKQKDVDWLLQIQNGLRAWLASGGVPSLTLQLVVERLNTRGASNKMLLEALALDSQLQNK